MIEHISRAPAQPAGGAPPAHAGVIRVVEEEGGERRHYLDRRVVAGAAAVALAGVAILKWPIASKVVGAVDGVDLLSNPRLPRGFAGRGWAVPEHGSIFGPPPGARVSIEHVDQGALGDCWNIAGFGAIAHRRPDVFEGMVREVGEHVVVDLPARSVAVTRDLPIGRTGGPAFGGSGPDDPVYWPAYVEKAQAAVARNGYRSLEGGITSTSFRQLLGNEPRQAASRGTILDDIAHHVRAKQPIAIATHSTMTADRATRRRMAELGIAANHYYVPTRVTGQGAEARVALFNPWGKDHPREPVGLQDLQRIFQRVDTPDEYVSY